MSASVQQIQAPLLSRLMDYEPENICDVDEKRYISFTQLQEDIKQNLENILNTRLMLLDADPQLTEVKQSVLHYGIPDFTQQYAMVKAQQKVLCQRIEKAINHFEPRLQQVSIMLAENPDKNSRILTIRINGTIVVKPIAKQTSFESSLDIVRYQFIFKDEL